MDHVNDAPSRVLVGFDGSDDAQAALAYGVSQAKARDAELAMVYAVDDTVLNSAWGVVVDPDAVKRDAGQMLETAANDVVSQGFPRERVRTSVVLGAPLTALSRLSGWASLVVVGRRSGSSERAFVGSTALGAATTSKCPVVVVCADNPLPPETTRIGVGVNVSARGGGNALAWALGEASRLGASLAAISVSKPASGRFFGSSSAAKQPDELVAEAKRQLDAIVASARTGFDGVDIQAEASYGSPVDTLVARSDSLDLLAVEVQASFPTYAVSGVARGLMTYARCPVALLSAKDSRGA